MSTKQETASFAIAANVRSKNAVGFCVERTYSKKTPWQIRSSAVLINEACVMAEFLIFITVTFSNCHFLIGI